MRVSLNWLREYVKVDVSVEELADRLTLGGLEVVAIERIGENWDPTKIFVGEVLSVRQHPNADRLSLVTVNYGAHEPIEVVTGAPNLRAGDAGQRVVLALVGARLIDGYSDTLRYQALKRSKIRGVVSEGMVCSEKELGISDEHTGIIILPEDAPVGRPLAEYWGDIVYDIDLTPNLARALSVVGVAREVAALTGAELVLPMPEALMEGDPIEGRIDIAIEDPDLCPRYSAALIEGISIGPSPLWMQRRLRAAGMRPINNIVDITNYVMLEWGQPLHAFDYQLLRPAALGGPPTIIVRRAREGEAMHTLDGEERALKDDMLLITDGGGPVAVAGIMGGLESEVTEETTQVLLEAASFDNISVRHTSAELRVTSEAAHRFGRGVDSDLTTVALQRASELMRRLAGGTIAQGFADAYPRPPATKVIDLRVSEVPRRLGISLEPARIAQILRSLDFTCQVLGGEEPIVRTTVPSYRLDVSIPEDLIEEVARIHGYDALPTTLMDDELPPQRRNMELELEERLRDILVGCGLAEIISYSHTNLESISKLEPNGVWPDPLEYIRLANPLTREQEYMRKTLMNTSLEAVSSNLRFLDRVALFEIARVYLPVEGGLLPSEPRRLSVALSGLREERSWLSNATAYLDFYDLKGIAETLCDHLGVQDARFEPAEHPTFQPGRVARVTLEGEEIGILGEVHPLVRRKFDLPEQAVCLLEFNVEALLRAAKPLKQYRTLSRMPALNEDLAFVVDEGAATDQIEATIREAGGPLLVDILLFDVYHGAQIDTGKKSLAYSLTFQALDKTLTTEQVAKQRQRIVAQLERVFEAKVRS